MPALFWVFAAVTIASIAAVLWLVARAMWANLTGAGAAEVEGIVRDARYRIAARVRDE